MRESSTNIQRYGFLTRAEGCYLFADSISAELKDAIAVAKAASPVGTHHLQIYNQILTSKYKALPPCEVQKWEQMAEDINSGNGSDDLKAQ